jgi:hypothetical protein
VSISEKEYAEAIISILNKIMDYSNTIGNKNKIMKREIVK